MRVPRKKKKTMKGKNRGERKRRVERHDQSEGKRIREGDKVTALDETIR